MSPEGAHQRKKEKKNILNYITLEDLFGPLFHEPTYDESETDIIEFCNANLSFFVNKLRKTQVIGFHTIISFNLAVARTFWMIKEKEMLVNSAMLTCLLVSFFKMETKGVRQSSLDLEH